MAASTSPTTDHLGLVLAVADSTAAMLVGSAIAGAMAALFGLTGIRRRP